MGAIGGLLGLGGGQSGTGVAAPQLAGVTPGTNTAQIDASYYGNQDKLQQQQQLLQALQGQNGLGNQSQVYGQLQGVANGTGPNPAQTMLNQATGANVANQAALMAGQRGAGANVGLLARQAAQQGAATQQQAAGQAANLQANQSLNAINAAGNIANTQATNQIGQTNANTNAVQAEQANLLGALQGQNQANVANQASVNSANAGMAQTQMQGQHGLLGGALNAIGSIFADGGVVGAPAKTDASQTAAFTPKSSFGQFLKSRGSGAPQNQPFQMASTQSPGDQSLQQGASKVGSLVGNGINYLLGGGSPGNAQTNTATQAFNAEGQASKGGLVDVIVSPGEKIVSPSKVKDVARGGKVEAKTVPGKAKVKGDSTKNDTVPARLPAGSIVVPRTKAKRGAQQFVQATLAKRGKK